MKRSVAFLLAAGLVLAMIPVIVGAFASDFRTTDLEMHAPKVPALEARALEAAVLKAPDPQETASFADVAPGSWYEEAVRWAVEHNVTSGVGEGMFGPNQNVTRAQVVTMLWRIENSPVIACTVTFSDVADGAWYTDAVAWAAERKIVAGYPGGAFAPSQTITRQELVTILFRYAKLRTPERKAPEGIKLDAYSDVDRVAAFAFEPMRWAVGTGVVNGTSATTLSPKGTATRAQLVQMLYRWLSKPTEEGETPPEPDPTEPAPTEPDPTEPTPTGDDWELPFLPNP